MQCYIFFHMQSDRQPDSRPNTNYFILTFFLWVKTDCHSFKGMGVYKLTGLNPSDQLRLHHIVWWWLFPFWQRFQENVRPFIPALFFSFFFFKVEISLRTLIPLFRPGSVHNGSVSDSVSWDICGQVFSDELCVSLFPDRFQHYDYDGWNMEGSGQTNLLIIDFVKVC